MAKSSASDIAQGHSSDMSVTLIALPQELLDEIAGFLDATGICSLRLACRALRGRTSRRFRSFFADRRTDLSPTSLQTLYNISASEEFGSVFQNLTIVAVVNETTRLSTVVQTGKMVDVGPFGRDWHARFEREALASSQAKLEVIEKMQLDISALIAIFRKAKKLRTVSLDIIVYEDTVRQSPPIRPRSWGLVSQEASRIYQLALAAIARSHLAVEYINIFASTMGWGICTHHIYRHMPHLRTDDLGEALVGLRRLSLGMTTRFPVARRRNDPRMRDPNNFLGPAQLLSLCPALEELHLHLYRLHGEPRPHYEAVMAHISTSVQLPKLRKCTLSGLDSSEESLDRFLRSCTRLESLELRRITLKSGSFRPIFKYCSSDAPALKELKLHMLWEDRLVEFDEGPVSFLDESGRASGVDSVIMDETELKKGVFYSFSTARP
ncbi:MAG: hypothetical protein M1839_002441 [Geoglossum umbratile]|nr:MAG: hypothetical protein M1839_002441 [Geoglossum umbratile]